MHMESRKGQPEPRGIHGGVTMWLKDVQYPRSRMLTAVPKTVDDRASELDHFSTLCNPVDRVCGLAA